MRVSYITKTKTLGPGERCAIWMQGCKKRCKGCINPEGQNLNGGYEISVEEIINEILQFKTITGVTISGGEPFIQYKELCDLVDIIKRVSDLDVMLFSGYSLSEIKEMYPNCMNLLNKIDIFIDGEYIIEENDNSMFRGSNNQKIYMFTPKYIEYKSQIELSKQREFSFEIKDDGDVFFVGIPPKELYEKFIEKIGGRNNEW